MDKTVHIKVEPKPIYARVLVPSYVEDTDWDNRHGEYCPWVISHTDESQIANEVLDQLYAELCDEMGTDDIDFSSFVEYLEERGYTVYNVEVGGVWRPQ